MKPEIGPEMMLRAARAAGFRAGLSRREFLFLSAGALTGLAVLNIGRVWGADAPIVIIENAKGLLLADPSRCVGCQRCELACTEFNDGRAQPSLARIKAGRNLNFGPEGPSGGVRMQGAWGSGRFVADTCRQCPHPVPCATACPEDAIIADPITGALRYVPRRDMTREAGPGRAALRVVSARRFRPGPHRLTPATRSSLPPASWRAPAFPATAEPP